MRLRRILWVRLRDHDIVYDTMLNWLFWGVAIAALITTLLPLTNSVMWWVRMWDFPRVHIAGVALVTLLAILPFALVLKPLLATV